MTVWKRRYGISTLPWAMAKGRGEYMPAARSR
jgi:hypothetical protein